MLASSTVAKLILRGRKSILIAARMLKGGQGQMRASSPPLVVGEMAVCGLVSSAWGK